MAQTQHVHVLVGGTGAIFGLATGFLVSAPIIGVTLSIVFGAGGYLISRVGWYSQVLLSFAGVGALCAGIAGVAMLADGNSETATAGAILTGVCLSVLLAIAVMIELIYKKKDAANKTDAGDGK